MIISNSIAFKDVKKYEKELLKSDEKFICDSNFTYFLLTEDKRILGYGIINNCEGKIFIKRIFVKKEYRFKSNGTKVLESIVYWAENNNIDKVYVERDEKSDYFFISNNFKCDANYLVLDNLLKDKKRKIEGLRGTWISIIVNIFLSIFKILFGIIGKSKALIADGLHSFSDVVTSIVVLISIHYASTPPDENHPYGHGQIEAISGNSIGLILVITSVLLLQENIISLFKTKDYVIPNKITLYIVTISIIIKYILYVYKIKMGKRLKNEAIIADAKDHKSDVISSCGVLIGLIMAIKLNPIFDTIAGVVVAFIIGKEGVGIIFDTSNKIMDKQEDGLLKNVENIVMQDERIYNVHNLIMKSSGDKVYLSFHIRIDKNTTIEKSHEIIDELVKKIKDKYEDVKGITIHTDPIRE